MGLGSSWWSGLGAAARWVPDFTDWVGIEYTEDHPPKTETWSYHRVSLGGFPRCYQGCIAYSGGANEPGYDTGIFYANLMYATLTNLVLSAAAGSGSASVSSLAWTHTGKIRVRAVKVSDDSVAATSGYYPTLDGTSYAGPITISGLSDGVLYRLEFWLDLTPNLAGYTEQWWKANLEWTQPAVAGRDVSITVENPIKVYAQAVAVEGFSTGGTNQSEDRPQFVEQAPPCLRGDCQPDAYLEDNAAYYRTPWVIDNPHPVDGGGYPYLGAVCTWWSRRDGWWTMRHYQPWAWFGTPAAVIAAIVMQAGMASAWIDQDSIDDAHDAYSGDAPWAALYAVHGLPTVYVARRVGQTVADLVYDVIRHTRDLLAVTMDGKLAVISRTRGPTLAGLTPADGLIDVESEGSNTDHLFNSANASFGHAYRSFGSDANPPDLDGDYSCSEERQLESYRGEKWSLSQADTNSQLKFGTVELPGQEVTLQISGQPKVVTRAHYPFYLNAAWGAAILTGYAAVDALPRRIVRLVQTFLGLDYGPGAKVTDVAITGDGATIATTYCIEKTLDFDLLRVESILAEEPTP